ncbi:MAG: hypothetical protein CFE25_05680 [Chitinophagaceae bacterium BSSC1]|nr:MAG: hypothetical protein CFE25_05680 [Chitinophagaceae bacterium BSSC1]
MNNRESLNKLLMLINEVSKIPGNEWFKKEIFKTESIKIPESNNVPINDIYEYCIKKIIKEHAEKFYSDFKIASIKQKLISDFVRMEQYRREDNFEDFCLAAFQQLESIVNYLIDKPNILNLIRDTKSTPAIHKFNFETKKYERKGSQTVGGLIFQTSDSNMINSNLEKPINEWAFNRKFRSCLYLFYFNTEIKTNTDKFDELYLIGLTLYQGRNLNHRGSTPTQRQKDIIDKLLPNQYKYYFKFLGFLEEFISTININLLT